MSEVWKDIKGYEGLYQVSNLGKVRSLQYNKQKILKIGYTNKGYGSINLCKNGKISHRNVHRLVAETFIPNPNKYFCVNHKDENPRNNNADNLEWCTIQYNNQYGTCAKRRNQNNKIPIKQYDKSNNFIKTWESAIDIQNQIGINQGSIIACCRNKLKTAGGYIWRYKENNITQKTKKQLIQKIDQLINQLAQEKEKNKELSEELTEQICKNVEVEVFEEMRLELKQEKEKNKELLKEYNKKLNADWEDAISKDKIKTKIDEINSLKYSDERLDRATIDFIINKFYRLLEEE